MCWTVYSILNRIQCPHKVSKLTLPPVGFPQATPVEDGGEVEEAGEEDRPDSAASKTDKKEPKITNQFNFSERASQTLNNPLRVGGKITSLSLVVTTVVITVDIVVKLTTFRQRHCFNIGGYEKHSIAVCVIKYA